MSTGLISLAAGVLIGLMYAVLKVRSPAPPALALIGLLGCWRGTGDASSFIPRQSRGRAGDGSHVQHLSGASS
ncbi:MAG: DUF1427 family protein [Enterobacter hormaechei]